MDKRIFVLSLCLTAALFLSGCGCEKDNTEAVTPPVSPSPSVSSDAEYEAGGDGSVAPDRDVIDTAPDKNDPTDRPGSSSSAPPSQSQSGAHTGSAAEDTVKDVEDTVNDLVENAKNAVRGRR